MSIHKENPNGMQVHCGEWDEPCTFFDGESVLEAKARGTWIEMWDPIDVGENQ